MLRKTLKNEILRLNQAVKKHEPLIWQLDKNKTEECTENSKSESRRSVLI